MNRGLKSYTKQIKQEVGNAGTVYVNVNENDANMHMILPLIKTMGNLPFEMNLIYDHQNRSDTDQFVGIGFKLDCYPKFSIKSETIDLTNPDGSTDTYTYGEFNRETKLKINMINNYTCQIEDIYGNKVTHQNPKQIEYITNKGVKINVVFEAGELTVTSPQRSDEIKLTKNGNKYISSVEYTYDGTKIASVNISYSGNRIQTIEYWNQKAVVAKTSIAYTSSSVTLKDEISGESLNMQFTGNKITSLTDNAGRKTSITYNGNRTTVTDFMNNKSHVIFDEDDMPRILVDNDYNVVGLNFDKTTKDLLSQSDAIQIQDPEWNIFPSLRTFDKSGVTLTEPSLSDSIFKNVIGSKVFRVTGTGTLTKEISKQGIATDKLTLAILGKLISGSAKVELSTLNEKVSAEFKAGKDFELLSFCLDAQKSFSKLKVTITLNNADISLSDIQVAAKDFGTFYQYDDSGNVTKAGTTEISYNPNNLPYSSIGIDSSVVGCLYDQKGNLTKALTSTGVTIENEYDSDNNPIKTIIKNSKGQSKVTKKEYDSRGFVTKETDSFGNSTTMTYTSDGNLKTVTDALGAVSEISYYNNGLIKSLLTQKGNEIEDAEAKYTYNEKNLLATVQLPYGSIYSFTYNSQNWLTSVALNDYTVFSFGYDEKTGNITRQTYGSGDSFIFTYGDDGLIQTVSYKSGSSVETKYTYSYDDYKRLSSVSDSQGHYKCTYAYDSDGRVSKTVTNGAQISYTYDNLGNVNNMTSEKSGTKVYQAFDSVQRSRYMPSEFLFKSFFGNNFRAFFEADGTLRNDKAAFAPAYGIKIDREEKVPRIRLDDTSRLLYNFPVKAPDDDNDTCSLMFWFKMDDVSKYAYLFYFGAAEQKNVIYAYVQNKKIILCIRDKNAVQKTVFTSTENVKEGWNFFAFTYKNRNDGAGYGDELTCSMTLNEVTQKNVSNISLRLGVSPSFSLGSLVGLSSGCMYGYAAALLISSRTFLSADWIKKYYYVTQDFLQNTHYADKDLQTVDFGQASVYTLNSTVQSKFEICPLRNNLLSLNGKRPVEFEQRKVSTVDRDKTFNYNQALKGYAYVADGSMLKYDFGQSKAGTIVVCAYTESSAERQYLFDCVDDSGKHIGLYRGADRFLYIDCNGNLINTSIILWNNSWQTVGLSFAIENAVYGSNGVLSIRVYKSGTQYNTQTSAVSFGALKVIVGMSSSASYPYNGQIQMLAANSLFNEVSTLNTLKTQLRAVSKLNEYNELGLLEKVDIHNEVSSVLTHTYNYGSGSALSERISKETIKYSNVTNGRSYTYDALGRIKSVTDSEFGSYSYTYDGRGFLTKCNSESFTYDKNGNITEYNGVALSYNLTIRDKLVKVGGNAVTYASLASLNPTSWNGRSYGYEGRRLTSFNWNGNVCSYEYDEQSHRTRRVVNGAITDYIYSGDKLIIEDGPNGILTFLYDENGQLYGFVKGSVRYYYIKDITGTILGIVSESGTLYAKYSYSAYGKCTITYNSENIASINPFRFKCYYYDTESQMYYCQTRYFVPDWGRWLNADNINFLQFDNMRKMNLFAYCGNNPVMNVDPSGEIFLSFLISAVVGGFVAAFSSALVQLATKQEINWGQVGISALFGAVGGMLSFWGIGGIAGQFFIQGILSVGELYSIAALNGNAAQIGAAEVVGTFLFAGAVGAIGARNGTKEFKRIGQIESSFLKYAKRDIFDLGKSVFSTIVRRGAKYLKEFAMPTIVNGFVTGGISTIANISDYWIQKLYDYFK